MAESSKFKFCFFELCEIFSSKYFPSGGWLNSPVWNQWIQRPTVLPLNFSKSSIPFPLCPLAAVRIKEWGTREKKLGTSPSFAIFRNRLRGNMLITFKGAGVVWKDEISGYTSRLNDPHLPKLFYFTCFYFTWLLSLKIYVFLGGFWSHMDY